MEAGSVPRNEEGKSFLWYALFLGLVILIADILIPLGYAVWVLFSVPLILSIRISRKGVSYALAAFYSALSIAAIFIGPSHIALHLGILNRLAGVGSLWIIAVLLERYKDASGLRALNEQLAVARDAAAERARIAEERGRTLQLILDHLNEGIIVADAPEGKIRVVSRWGVDHALGSAPDTEIDQSLERYLERWDVRSIDTGEKVRPEDLPIARSLRGETVQGGEWLMVRPDGSSFAASVNSVPIYDAERKNVINVVATWVDVTDKKRFEDELRHRENEYRTLFENLPDGVMRLDREFRYLYVNRAGEEILESTRERIIGKFVGMFGMPEEAQAIFRENIVRTADTLEPGRMEFCMPRKERAYHYAVRFVPERTDTHGETVLSIFTDITELKEAEGRLLEARDTAERRAREAEEGRRVLETMMEHIPEGIIIVDVETKRVQTASAYIAGMAGMSRQDFDGMAMEKYAEVLAVSTPENNPVPTERLPIWRSLHRGEIVANEEYLLTKKNGERLTVLINTVPIRGAGGGIIGALAAWRDITELKRSTDRLRRSEYELRTLVDNSPDLIVRFDRAFRYVYANPAYERLTGVGREQLAEKTSTELGMAKELAALFETTLGNVVETGREMSVEFDLAGLFGKRYFWGRMIPEFSRSGLVDTVMLLARDITERKKSEEHIRFISFHDNVTGLYNRAYFEEEVKRLDTERSLPLSIIMGDVNNLKLVNDTFGHGAGDRLLKAIADILRAACRNEDIVARWGGDEFAVILPRTDYARSGEIVGRIRELSRESRGTVLQPSIALGVDTKDQRDQNVYRTIRQAEERMYDNKLAESKGNQERVILSLLAKMHENSGDLDAHIERSLGLAARFGLALGVSEHQLDDLNLLIRLHDIGKAATPAEILRKPGRLTTEEWETVKRHAEAGFRIVKTFAETARISDEVLAHGERWNGTGYPRGLRGKEIPYLARVLAVIDVFDVMTHERPYARPCSQAEAFEEIRLNAGRQFDPDLVDIFLAAVQGKTLEEIKPGR